MRLGVAAEAVRSEFKKSSNRRPVAAEEPAEASAPAGPRPTQSESWLLRFLLESDDHVSWMAAHLELDWLTHPMVREIAAQRFAGESSGSWPGLAPWLSQLGNPAWQNFVTEILAESRPVRDVETLLKGSPIRDGAVKILRDKHIDLQLAALKQSLNAPDLKEDGQRQLLTQMERLRQLKKQPLTPKPVEGEA
jgi:hypothetical protein